jgi:hypothetical protein
MFVALVYHNVVPSICASLEGDRRKARASNTRSIKVVTLLEGSCVQQLIRV